MCDVLQSSGRKMKVSPPSFPVSPFFSSPLELPATGIDMVHIVML
jgi:hypothetical protein